MSTSGKRWSREAPQSPHWLPSPVRPIQAPVRGAVVLHELLGNGCMQQQQQCCRMWIPAVLGRTTYIHASSSSGMRVKTEGLLTGHNLLMLWHNSYMLIGRLIWSCNCALLRQGQAPPGFMLRPSALFRGHHRSQHNCPSTLYQNIFLFHWTLFEAVKSGQKWKYLSLVSLSRLQFHVSALICEFHSDTARTQFGQHYRLILNNGFTQIISTFLVSSVGFRNDSGLDLAL